MAYAYVGIGLLLLLLGSETVLRGGIGLSRAFGLSPLLIGLLVVSIGTCAPELAVSLHAALGGAPDIALGNIVGSNIVNVLLILGLGALVRPMSGSPRLVFRDGGAMLVSSLALLAMAQTGTITRIEGWFLLGGFAIYVLIAFFTDRRRAAPTGEARAQSRMGAELPLALCAVLMIFGLVCLYFGAHFVIDGAMGVANAYHVPQAVIGLTLVAAGASLPELATMLVASARGHSAIAIGNLIGSNIFNILFVLGLTASIHPLSVSPMLAGFDIYVLVAAAALPLAMLLPGWRLSRLQGALLVASYLGYVAYLAWRQGLLTPALLGLG